MNLKAFQVAAVDLAALAWPDEMQDPGRLDAELGDKLSEEVGELAKVCRRHGSLRTHWRGAAPVTDDQVLDEVGDVLFVLARRAALHGIDLGAAADWALAKFQERLKQMGIKFRQMTMEEMVAEPVEGTQEKDARQFVLDGLAACLPPGVPLGCEIVRARFTGKKRAVATVTMFDGKPGVVEVSQVGQYDAWCIAWSGTGGGAVYWNGTAWVREDTEGVERNG